ncbi:hypothetical protein Tco_0710702 [Tanacetum coccineum]
MDNTKAQQKALDDDLVAPANRLKIGKSSLRLSSNLKSKEPTLQVALDALKLTSFYKAFEIIADVPEIYIEMLQICPKLPGQKFEDPPFEEEILSFIRDLGHTDYFMAKDFSIPRRNKMFWHYARDDPMFATIRVISKHQDTQLYGALLPQHLTNQAMLESEAYKTYHAYAMTQDLQQGGVYTAKKDKRLKTSTKIKLATKRSLIQTHSSHASSSSADKGTGIILGVSNAPTYNSNDEQISWKSSDEEDDDEVSMSKDDDDNADDDQNDDDADNKDDDDQEDDDEQTDSNNDGDNFVHPKFSTHDQEERQDEEEGSDLRVQTPSHYESTDDEESDEVTQGGNVKGEELNEETDEDEEVNELYRDVNVNLEGRDTDAQQTNVQGTHVTEDTHVIMTAVAPEVQQQSSFVSSGFISNMLNPNPDSCIKSELKLWKTTSRNSSRQTNLLQLFRYDLALNLIGKCTQK